MATILPLRAADRPDWDGLWRGYLDFYETTLAPEVVDDVFVRLVGDDELHGAIARDADGTAVGLVHWLTHPATWTTTSYCYLEDLYVAPEARGGGVGAALVAHVRAWAEAAGSSRLYWLTASGNAAARALYDRVARETGMVQYAVALPG